MTDLKRLTVTDLGIVTGAALGTQPALTSIGIGDVSVSTASYVDLNVLYAPAVPNLNVQHEDLRNARSRINSHSITEAKSSYAEAYLRSPQARQYWVSDDIRRSHQATTTEQDARLKAALTELDGAPAEAREEGFDEPSEQAIEYARRLVLEVHRLRQAPIEVCPTAERDIAIYTAGTHRRSVTVLCESGGGALCLVNLNGRYRRAVYSSADMLPDGFLREGLADIDEP